MSISVIELDHLSVTIGKTPILRDLSIKIPEGTITGLLGPSGAGKTTLLRAIVGLQKPSAGTVHVLGRPGGSKKLRSQIGYMTQNLSIYPDLTILENFRYFATISQVPAGDIKPMLAQLHLTEVQHHLISQISGGQKTRVSLGCALIANPRLLVLDEPTVGIDPVLRAEIWDYLRELASSGTTLLISSHVMDEASHCDSLILLRDGRLLATDKPDMLMNDTHTQTIEQAFLKLVGNHS